MSPILLVREIKLARMLSCTFASFMMRSILSISLSLPPATDSSRLPDLMKGNGNIFIVTYRVHDKRKVSLYTSVQPNEKFHFHFRSLFIAMWRIWLFPLAFLRGSSVDRI